MKLKFSIFPILALFFILLICLGNAYAVDNDDIVCDDVLVDEGSSSSMLSSSMDKNIISNANSAASHSVESGADDSSVYTNLYRENDTYVLEGNSFESIQYAIDSVEENSSIVLHGMDALRNVSNFYGNGYQIVINKSITLDGQGSTLDAKYLSRIFYITANNVTLTNLNLINANHRNNDSFDDGASSCNYPYNFYELGTVGGNGGVIKWLGDDGCLQNTVFSDNLFAEVKIMDGTIISWEGKNGIIINSYFGINYFINLMGLNLNPPSLSKIIDAPIYGDYGGDLYKNNILIKSVIVNAESVWNRLNHKNLYRENDYYVLEGDSFEDIQQAINSVEENSYIKLRGINFDGAPSNFNGKGSEIVINKSITLDGNGVTLDAQRMSRMFYITADNVSLLNLNFINANHRDGYGYGLILWHDDTPKYITGSVGDNGGVIQWLGDNGSLVNSTFMSNQYTGLEPSGRVISWEGKNGTIIGSYFKSNSIYYKYSWKENTTGSSIINRYLYGDYYGDLYGDNLYVRNASVIALDNPIARNLSCYYGANKVYYNISTDDGIIFSNQNVTVTVYNKKYNKTFNCTTDSNGRLSLDLSNLPVGKYVFICNCSSVSYIYKNNTLIFNSTLTVLKAPVKFVSSTYKTAYDSGKMFNVKLLNTKDNSAVSGVKLSLKFYTGKSYKTLTATTNSKGIASFSLSKNTVGNHKIIISASGNVVSAKKNSSITITKASANVKLSKSTFKYKKSDYLKMTLTNGNTKKPISKLTVKVKVYTGKSYKTYSLKTDQNGIVKINTKGLKKGSHKIVISLSSKYYALSRTAAIKVK